MKRKLLGAGVVVVVLLSVTAFYAPTDKYFEITRNLDIFASLFKEVNAYYVDEIDPEKSIRIGMDAMLASLDPYTSYIPEEDLDAYVTMTTGEYGGIGALIGYLDEKVLVTMPNEGFPAHKAGVRIGDEIIEVDGVECNGKNTQEVSALLKGNSGTEVNIKVKRAEEIIDFNITRAKIVIKNVPYFGMVGDDIGYIKLTEFTTDAAKEVKTALVDLKKQGAEKIVLDLRGNPGGILQEANEICNLFLPKGKLVVETKYKTDNWNQLYKTTSKPVDTEIPLAVLTSSGSASASEIVSGTIQDYDRGVLVGRRTFGKGLVQTTRPLGYNTQLKITVAKYYTPSGRCIQAIDYAHRNEDGSVGKIPDSLKVAFKTANGRTVYDGGGIMPDIAVDPEYYSPVAMSLLSEAYLFNYANEYYRQHESEDIDMKSFVISEEEYSKFLTSFDKSSLQYKTELEQAILKFESDAKKTNQIDIISDELNALKLAASHDQNKDLENHKEEIKQLLSEEIVGRYFLLKGEIANSLSHDPDLDKAIEILNNPAEYNRILSAKL